MTEMAPFPLYVIRSLELTNEDDGAALYWSNADGWIAYDIRLITVFSEEEMRCLIPPMSQFEWVKHR